jgi:hypothetical protein
MNKANAARTRIFRELADKLEAAEVEALNLELHKIFQKEIERSAFSPTNVFERRHRISQEE